MTTYKFRVWVLAILVLAHAPMAVGGEADEQVESAPTGTSDETTEAPKAEGPECPEGCVSFAFVRELQGDGSISRAKCPAGCVAFEEVKGMHENEEPDSENTPAIVRGMLSESEYSSLRTPEYSPTARTTGGIKHADHQQEFSKRSVDGGVFHHVFQQTALGPKPGEHVITGYAAGLWKGEHGVHENISLGFYTLLPVGVFGFGAKLKLHSQIGDNVAVALSALGALGGPYIDGLESVGFLGSLQVTLSVFSTNKKHILSVSNNVLGMSLCDSGECEGLNETIMIPSAAYRFAFTRRWAANIEWWMPLVVSQIRDDFNGRLHFLSYGFQVHGETMFGDFGFIMPLSEDITEFVVQVFPLGVPYFTIGFKI